MVKSYVHAVGVACGKISVSPYSDEPGPSSHPVSYFARAEARRPAQDFHVKDITLADWGRKEISVAEHEMPGLISCRRKFGLLR